MWIADNKNTFTSVYKEPLCRKLAKLWRYAIVNFKSKDGVSIFSTRHDSNQLGLSPCLSPLADVKLSFSLHLQIRRLAVDAAEKILLRLFHVKSIDNAERKVGASNVC